MHMAHQASANSLDALGDWPRRGGRRLASMINIEQDKEDKEKRKAEKERLKKLQDFIVKQVSKPEAPQGFY